MDMWFIVTVLVIGNIINAMLIKTKRLKMTGKAIISLFTLSVIASTAPDLYSHYASEPLYVMNHTLFKTAIILGTMILVQEKILAVLIPLYNAVEVRVFDQLNYLLARITITTSETLRRTQTGNLNRNMFMILIFFLLCLIILII